MNKEDFERLKSECNNAQFDLEEFRVSDIKQLINEIEQLKKDKKGKCQHNRKFRYNHGYHTICLDCGEEVD